MKNCIKIDVDFSTASASTGKTQTHDATVSFKFVKSGQKISISEWCVSWTKNKKLCIFCKEKWHLFFSLAVETHTFFWSWNCIKKTHEFTGHTHYLPTKIWLFTQRDVKEKRTFARNVSIMVCPGFLLFCHKNNSADNNPGILYIFHVGEQLPSTFAGNSYFILENLP